ncbi:MAG: redoxin domain-containing protein [Planctomycetaceae bacterium]|nr:redoxin domain-containing protein [Planctomycetaceae bacterium]
MELKIGDNAPDFATKDEAGNPVSLAAFKNKHPVALVFFPKDDTPG